MWLYLYLSNVRCVPEQRQQSSFAPAAVAGYLLSAPLAPAVKAVMKAELES